MPGKKGGRIQPDGRPVQAPGVGRDAKRHDLEAQPTPGLHGSDLQYGDAQALEEGQRIAPAQEQGSAVPTELGPAQTLERTPDGGMIGSLVIPDAIDFLSGQNKGAEFTPPIAKRRLDESKASTWLPLLRQLVQGPGTSSALVNAFINQARLMAQTGSTAATMIDLHAADDGIEEMLSKGIR